MNTKITTSTLQEMTGLNYENNKMGFASKLKKHGLDCSEKTIIRALESDSMGDSISIVMLIRMCEQYSYPFARCFTFYNVNGLEKPAQPNGPVKLRTDKPVQTNLLELANDICNTFPRLPMVRSEMGLDLDFMQLANENINALNDIPATVFVEKLMDKHFDVNKYIWQEGFTLPYQYSGSLSMAAEELPPTNERTYLSAYLDLRIKVRDANKDFDIKMKQLRQRGNELIENGGDLMTSIFELLILVKKTFKPFTFKLLTP